MGWLRDLLLPSTDGAVFVQALIVLAVFGFVLSRVWSKPDQRLFTIGLLILVIALFGVRAIH